MDQRSSPMGLYSFLGSSFGVLWSTRVCCPDPSQFARWNNVQKIKRLNWATRSTSLACSQVTLLMVLSRTLLLCRYLEGDALDSDDSDDDDQPDEFEGNCDDETNESHQSKLAEMFATFSNTCSITAARTTPSSYAKVREHQPKTIRADPSTVTATASKRGSPSISLPASRLQ